MVTPAEPVLKQKAESIGSLKMPAQSTPSGGAVDNYPVTIIMKTLTGQGMPVKQAQNVLGNLAKQAQKGAVKFGQIKDTVFIVTPKPDMSAEFFITSIEPDQIPKRIVSLSKSLKEMGFRKMTTISPVGQSAELANKTGLQVKKTQTQMMSQGKMTPAFRYEVAL
jgi:hypothetical protein